MRRFGVSRMTAARAVDELRRRGLVASQQGRGTFVTRIGASRKIGFLVPGLCYVEVFPPICRKLSHLCQDKNANLLVGDISSDDPETRAEQAVDMARRFVRDGVLGVFLQPVELFRNADAVNHEILGIFSDAKIPVILIDNDVVRSPARSECDIVGINNFEAGRRMAEHLVAVGARRIGFVKEAYCDYSVQNRFEGVRSVVSMLAGRSAVELAIDTRNLAAVRRVLVRRPRLDAIVCRNDHQAAHLLVALRKLGKRVPEDVMVAGFNDVEYASVLEPALTSIHVPCDDIAAEACDMLWSRIMRPDLPPRECYLPAPLVVRGSTARAKR